MTIGGPTVLAMFLSCYMFSSLGENTLTKEQVSKVRRLIQEGHPVAHIAKEIECGRTRVYNEKRRMESEARGKDRKVTSGRKLRRADAVGGFQERARKIELVEHIRGLKKRAEEIASGSDLAESERERLTALALQCDEAINAMASFSATDAALVCKELEGRVAEASRKVASRIDSDHKLAVDRGRLGHLNRQLKAIERKLHDGQEELRILDEQKAARGRELGLLGDLAKANQTLADLRKLINARQEILRNTDQLIELTRQRGFNDWLGEIVSSYPMSEVERNALQAIVLRRMQTSSPERSRTTTPLS